MQGLPSRGRMWRDWILRMFWLNYKSNKAARAFIPNAIPSWIKKCLASTKTSRARQTGLLTDRRRRCCWKNSELAAFFGFPRRALYASHLLEQQVTQIDFFSPKGHIPPLFVVIRHDTAAVSVGAPPCFDHKGRKLKETNTLSIASSPIHRVTSSLACRP